MKNLACRHLLIGEKINKIFFEFLLRKNIHICKIHLYFHMPRFCSWSMKIWNLSISKRWNAEITWRFSWIIKIENYTYISVETAHSLMSDKLRNAKLFWFLFCLTSKKNDNLHHCYLFQRHVDTTCGIPTNTQLDKFHSSNPNQSYEGRYLKNSNKSI